MNSPMVCERYEPATQGRREALYALGNGYFVTRGAAPEATADSIHYPGTYLAGGYNRLRSSVAGRDVENEDLVNLPNWLSLAFRIDGGDWLSLDTVDVLDYHQALDLTPGLTVREVRWRDSAARTVHLHERRFVSMHQPHLAALAVTFTALDWHGTVELRSALDGEVQNGGVHRYQGLNGRHLVGLEAEALDGNRIYLKVRTTQSRLEVAQAARTRLGHEGENVRASPRIERRLRYVAQIFERSLAPGESITIEKVVALYTSRDRGISECGHQARRAVTAAASFDELLVAHRRQWAHLWRRFDTTLELDPSATAAGTVDALRLHLFHLLQTVSPHTEDLDAGVPARGWHGEAYRGHIFWDELFIFPLLNLRVPEITRALLEYRCRRLPAAREAARAAGFRGAMFPWQSASDGREESQRLHLNPRSGRWVPDHSHLQRHVNATVAYNVWQYFQATEDMEYLAYHGAELILEIARFWASASRFNPAVNRYEIEAVMGPDEYHEAYPGSDQPGIKNNSYTNVMAVWVLDCALSMLEQLSIHRRIEPTESLELEPAELERWRDICAKMRLVFLQDGILAQFEGYPELKELDWSGYGRRYGDIRRLDRILEAEGDTANAYKLSKQADVLMLFYVLSAEELERLITGLGYPFDPNLIPQTIEYYSARTAHGSTLSRVVSAWVMARRDRAGSWALFEQALAADVGDDGSGTTHEGIHLGAMAGTVDLIQRCYTGIEARHDALHPNPCLPAQIRQMKLRIRYRDHLLRLHIEHDRLTVSSLKAGVRPMDLQLPSGLHRLHGGDTVTADIPHAAEPADHA